MAKSSGNFKKAKSHAEDHNSRKKEPYYLLPSEFRTPNGRGSEFVKFHDAREFFDRELAKKNATKVRGKRPRFENSVFEIEVNCNENHTLDDGIKLSKELEQLLNYTCCSIALHRDEGHLERDKSGKVFPIYNYHFHLVFETYKDGTQWARHEHNQEIFQNSLQDVIAASLNMQRGETKEDRLKRVAEKLGEPLELVQRQTDETAKQWYGRLDKLAEDKGIVDFKAYFELKPRKHIDSREYRQVAQEREQAVLTLEETEQLFNEHLRNAEIKIEELESSKTALESQNQTLKQQNSKDEKTISDLKEENTVLHNDKKSLNSELLTLKQQKAQIEEERKKYKEEGDHIAEEYRKLQALSKTKHTQEELDKALAELRQQYEERISAQNKEITELTDNNTVLSKSNKALEEKLDNYTVLYNNSIHEQNLAQTDLRTYPTLEELTYERFNLETQYGIRQVYDYEKYRGEFSQEKSMQRLSERGMVHQRANSDLSMHSDEVSKLRDGDTADHQHKLLRTVYSETMIYSVNPQTDRVLSVEDQIRYNNLYSLAKKYADNLTSVAKKLGIKYENKEDQYLSNIQKKTVELCNTVLNKPKEIVKTVEVVKEVPREITTTDVENHPRFLALQQEKDNQETYYKKLLANPDLEKLDKLVFITPDDLTPRLKSTKWGGFKEVLESPRQIAERINEQLKNGKLRPILENDSILKASNTVLSNDNNKLKNENAELKSWKENCMELLHNFGFYIGEKLPSIEDVKNTVKSFTSRLFSAFIMNNDHDIDYVQNKIVDGQEYKQAQIVKQQQIEQQRREERQKQKERAKQQQQIEQERGGMSL